MNNKPSKFDLWKDDYDFAADELRKNRVRLGWYKYGPAKSNYKNGCIQAIPSCLQCIQKYKDTKNTEYLLDAMNYLMFEKMYPQLDGAFFEATDASGTAGIVGLSVNEIKKIKEDIDV